MLRILTLIIISLLGFDAIAQNSIIERVDNYLDSKNIFTDEIIYVSIKKQTLYHIQNKRIIKEYTISSSSYGIGSKSGSNKTPIGLHSVKEKYGDKTPINGIMVSRVFLGNIATIYNDETKSKTDDITSRILWLDGLEKGKNKGKGIDSFNRYIYIHGTSEEGRLGKPASNGCIRMKNKEVIDLYKLLEVGTLVLIL
jgi:lipoprotein-anchoring transpeptidase ErfK/SrfK|tara:strand:+ start:206 stop:796 length:591 start_codon:yes stop_codon:yes gene_type:complete